jgi:hypothetical protein
LATVYCNVHKYKRYDNWNTFICRDTITKTDSSIVTDKHFCSSPMKTIAVWEKAQQRKLESEVRRVYLLSVASREMDKNNVLVLEMITQCDNLLHNAKVLVSAHLFQCWQHFIGKDCSWSCPKKFSKVLKQVISDILCCFAAGATAILWCYGLGLFVLFSIGRLLETKGVRKCKVTH